MLAKFSLRPYLSLSKFSKRKRQFPCCVHLLHKAGSSTENRKFHVVVVQRRQRNVQNSVTKLMFVNINILFFAVLLAVAVVGFVVIQK